MIHWYNTKTEDKVKIYNEIAIDTGLPAFVVEKDWWVVNSHIHSFFQHLACFY